MQIHRLNLPVFAALLLVLAGCAGSSPANPAPGPAGEPGAKPDLPGKTNRGAVLYSPVSSARYRLDSRDSVAMEMPDGSFQRTVTAKTAFLTISLRENGTQLAAEISLDSMALDRPNPMVQPLVDSALGSRWQGAIRANGKIDSLTPNRTSVFGEQIRTMLQRLLPVLPPGGAEADKSWSDSASMPFQLMAGFTAGEERIAEFRATRWEDVKGTRALLIESTTNYTVSGNGSGFGQEITLEGSGQARGRHRVSAAGRLVQAEVTDSVRMTLTVPAVGQTVPTTVIGTYAISPLP